MLLKYRRRRQRPVHLLCCHRRHLLHRLRRRPFLQRRWPVAPCRFQQPPPRKGHFSAGSQSGTRDWSSTTEPKPASCGELLRTVMPLAMEGQMQLRCHLACPQCQACDSNELASVPAVAALVSCAARGSHWLRTPRRGQRSCRHVGKRPTAGLTPPATQDPRLSSVC